MEITDDNRLSSLELDPDLHSLEQQINGFNILEALGIVRQELRHSDFLAFLLDPKGKHDMRDFFLKLFLEAVILSSASIGESASGGEDGEDAAGHTAGRVPVSCVELEKWTLDNAQVYRELYNIDVLVIDESHKFAVIIENKIDTTEHSGQLTRYLDIVGAHFPRCKRVLAIYLTPNGSQSSIPHRYLSASYGLLHNVIEEVVTARASTLAPDCLTLLQHYTMALRRHIMSDSSIGELCRRIYARHKTALDLIYEHRFDRLATMADQLKGLIAQSDQFTLDVCDKTYIRFYPRAWNISQLRVAEDWTPSNMLLLFEFINESDRVRLVLYLGPSTNPLRARLFSLAQRKKPPFRPPSTRLAKWSILWEETIVPPSLYEEDSEDALLRNLNEWWVNFIGNPLEPHSLRAFVDAVLGELAGMSEQSAVDDN